LTVHTADLYVPDRILSSHCEADTCATTTFERSLAHPVTLLLSFPRYTFSLLGHAI
jgi:hypothetical protein